MSLPFYDGETDNTKERGRGCPRHNGFDKMKRLCLVLASVCACAAAQSIPIRVDIAKRTGPLGAIWSFFGHDEPNYTYMRDGRSTAGRLSTAFSTSTSSGK
jgi:xylan 1,4-beta-xylosidase